MIKFHTIFIVLATLSLSACSQSAKTNNKEADTEDYPEEVHVYYSKLSQEDDTEMIQFYDAKNFLHEYDQSIYDAAAFTATNHGYAVEYNLKENTEKLGSIYENPAENHIQIKTSSGEYNTFWSHNNWQRELYNGTPIYEYCAEAEYSDILNQNECVKNRLMYGDNIIDEVKGRIYFHGMWDSFFVYSDYDSNTYLIDFENLQNDPQKIDRGEGQFSFLYLEDGEPILYEYNYDNDKTLILHDRIEEYIVDGEISGNQSYFIKRSPFEDYQNITDFFTFNILKDRIKVGSINKTLSQKINLEFIDSKKSNCIFEVKSFPFLANNPCINGENIFWINHDTIYDETTVTMNGSKIIMPSNWYLPSLVQYGQYTPPLNNSDCLEENCFYIESLSPVFKDKNNFGILATVNDNNSIYHPDLYYLTYQDNSFVDAQLLEKNIKEFYGTIQP